MNWPVIETGVVFRCTIRGLQKIACRKEVGRFTATAMALPTVELLGVL